VLGVLLSVAENQFFGGFLISLRKTKTGKTASEMFKCLRLLIFSRTTEPTCHCRTICHNKLRTAELSPFNVRLLLILESYDNNDTAQS